MKVSARRAAQFRYAFGAGYSAEKYGLSTKTKTMRKWWNEAFYAGQRKARYETYLENMKRYRATGNPYDWEPPPMGRDRYIGL